MYVDADVLFLEAWELECGGDEVLFGVFVQVHSVETSVLGSGGELGISKEVPYLGLKCLIAPSPPSP